MIPTWGDRFALIAWLAGGAIAGWLFIEHIHPRLWVWWQVRREARRQDAEHVERCKRALDKWGGW